MMESRDYFTRMKMITLQLPQAHPCVQDQGVLKIEKDSRPQLASLRYSR